MSLSKEKMREYQRDRRAKEKALKKETVVVIPAVLGKGKKVEVEWDPEMYPNKLRWEDAVGRAERAKRYALMFPERTGKTDVRFQDIAYQYLAEGKTLRDADIGSQFCVECGGEENHRDWCSSGGKKDGIKLFEQRCDKCNGFWSASIILVCPYCDGTGTRKPLTR